MTPDELTKYLSFYKDLGIKTLYRRDARLSQPDMSDSESTSNPAPDSQPAAEPSAEAQETSLGILPSLAPEGDTLQKIRAEIGDCARCRLHEGRNKLVFGDGNPNALVVFVGEGPGADEDAQGIPFVGRAGQLLTKMIDNTAAGEGIPISRKDVYICNVVKCRPPGNRNPEPDEMEVCGQFLFRQLMAIQPKAIVAMGGVASRALLGKRDGVTKLRGKWHRWHEFPVMVTFHPSYLLRAYNKDAKRDAWEDLKRVFHFAYD